MKFKEYGVIARAARLKLGLTQKQIADSFGWTTPQFVSNIESGKSFYPAHCLAIFPKATARKLSDCEIRLQIKRYKERKNEVQKA